MPVPAKMRRALSPAAKETFVATRGLERCVFLYPLDAWEAIEEEMGRLNQFDPEARGFVRTINMWAEELALDGQGRIALPKANPGYYLTLSLGITFPFNLAFGIPLLQKTAILFHSWL